MPILFSALILILFFSLSRILASSSKSMPLDAESLLTWRLHMPEKAPSLLLLSITHAVAFPGSHQIRSARSCMWLQGRSCLEKLFVKSHHLLARTRMHCSYEFVKKREAVNYPLKLVRHCLKNVESRSAAFNAERLLDIILSITEETVVL